MVFDSDGREPGEELEDFGDELSSDYREEEEDLGADEGEVPEAEISYEAEEVVVTTPMPVVAAIPTSRPPRAKPTRRAAPARKQVKKAAKPRKKTAKKPARKLAKKPRAAKKAKKPARTKKKASRKKSKRR